MYFTTSKYFLEMVQKGYIPSQQVLENAEKFLRTINEFIAYLYEEKLLAPDYKIELSSGWRSPDYNRQISKATMSHHIAGQAIDLAGNEIILLLEKDITPLKNFKLYAESILDAPHHTHLQCVCPPSGEFIFRA